MERRNSASDPYFEHVLSERTIFADKPPCLQPFDEKIASLNGATFALDLQPQKLQAKKYCQRPSFEQRLVEIVRENSSYRRELCFFRAAYEAMEVMQKSISTVAQQLILGYYLSANNVSPEDNQCLQLSDDLDTALRRYKTVVNEAMEDWIELTREQPAHDEGHPF